MLPLLQTSFPESTHVCLVGLEHSTDAEIWFYAGIHDFVIVTRDSDFSEMATLYGPPPKVVRLCIRNCRWQEMAAPLIQNFQGLIRELEQPETVLVEIPSALSLP